MPRANLAGDVGDKKLRATVVGDELLPVAHVHVSMSPSIILMLLASICKLGSHVGDIGAEYPTINRNSKMSKK
jgi:hypothetical protein